MQNEYGTKPLGLLDLHAFFARVSIRSESDCGEEGERPFSLWKKRDETYKAAVLAERLETTFGVTVPSEADRVPNAAELCVPARSLSMSAGRRSRPNGFCRST